MTRVGSHALWNRRHGYCLILTGFIETMGLDNFQSKFGGGVLGFMVGMGVKAMSQQMTGLSRVETNLAVEGQVEPARPQANGVNRQHKDTIPWHRVWFGRGARLAFLQLTPCCQDGLYLYIVIPVWSRTTCQLET